MTFTPETGAGVTGANCYYDLTDWADYYDLHLRPPSASDQQKKAAGVMATRALEAAVVWKGIRLTTTQGLHFPAGGITIPQGEAQFLDGSYYDGHRVIPSDVVPTEVKHATLELARFYLAKDRDKDFDAAPVKRRKVDVIEQEFFSAADRPDQIPQHVLRMIKDFVTASPLKGGISTMKIRRT